MADTDATPMGESDFTADSNTHVAAPLKGSTTDTKQAIKDGATKYTAQAADKARSFADDGKARAGTALDQIAQLLTDAAGQVDEKLGAQYGTYARSAADSVSGFADQVKAKDMDELIDDARELVRKSPAIAVGAAAAVGFVIARLVQSGVDANPKG
ncbi:hypothetical protein EQZ23_04790 [Sphingomonas sp. UV9]|uniref:hypothetical protein n=1 Tax=Sphingomonas sp. UV9 TaxID=1851410 RepID=UPI000FFC9F67|nr:hypothetical protein [Sphingomonas sp. UV9]RXD07364.1 hypothetical protein EQZ23_04790 [Sphingomonas sp. UV9]